MNGMAAPDSKGSAFHLFEILYVLKALDSGTESD